jgi:hypothetical protein
MNNNFNSYLDFYNNIDINIIIAINCNINLIINFNIKL